MDSLASELKAALMVQAVYRGFETRKILYPKSHSDRKEFLIDGHHRTHSDHALGGRDEDLELLADTLAGEQQIYMLEHRTAVRSKHRKCSISGRFGFLTAADSRDLDSVLREGETCCSVLERFCNMFAAEESKRPAEPVAKISRGLSSKRLIKQPPKPTEPSKQPNPYEHGISDAYFGLKHWTMTQKSRSTGRTWPDYHRLVDKLNPSSEYVIKVKTMQLKVEKLLKLALKTNPDLTRADNDDTRSQQRFFAVTVLQAWGRGVISREKLRRDRMAEEEVAIAEAKRLREKQRRAREKEAAEQAARLAETQRLRLKEEKQAQSKACIIS